MNDIKYTTNPDFLLALIRTRVEQLRLPENKVFVADRNDKIVDVWSGLVKHNFLSVPVMTNLLSPNRSWFGFIDVADIMTYVVNHFDQQRIGEEGQDFWELVKADEEFQKRTVEEVMQYSFSRTGGKDKHLFRPVKVGYSLYYAIESLAKEKDLHRLVVLDDDGTVLNLITQSHIIDFLYQNIDKIGSKMNKPVGDFFKNIIYSVKEDEQAIEAFKLMMEKNVSGVAIVDEEGKVKGNISSRDLKAIATDGSLFWRLYSKAYLFRQNARKEADPTPPRGTVTVHKGDSLGEVIKKLAENKIHRVYVIDEERRPLGVISLRDVLVEILSSC